MKKTYMKPMLEVMKFQAGGLMEDGHSNNMPTAKGYGFFDDEEDDDLSNDLWDKDDLWK